MMRPTRGTRLKMWGRCGPTTTIRKKESCRLNNNYNNHNDDNDENKNENKTGNAIGRGTD